MIDIRRDRMVTGSGAARRRAPAALAGMALAASAAVALAACGGSAATVAAVAASSPTPGAAATDYVQLTGKIDADTGAVGTFTGKDGWPAVAPSDIHVRAGSTVVITIREYDDMITPLADQSAFLHVMGGTETVNGKQITSVSNHEIAHTFTVPTLGINVPLPVASEDGPTTVRFTFRAPSAPGTYQWLCVTPCGTGPDGISGAMHLDGWMRGHLIVS